RGLLLALVDGDRAARAGGGRLGRRSGPLLREPSQRDLERGGAGGRPDLGGPVREFGERQLPAADHRLELLLGDGAGVVVWLLRHRGPSPFMIVTRSAVRRSEERRVGKEGRLRQ